MEFKTLGTSSVRVPAIGLGTWKYTGGVAPLREGIARGACLIDTAEIYGTEEIVGEAIRGIRQQVLVATKISPKNLRKRDVIAAAERSLRRLGTDYIDLYQIHWPNYAIPIEETMSAMEGLVDAGKVRQIGVSNFNAREIRKAQASLSRHKIVSNQVPYSLVERTVESGVLQYCLQNKITVIAYSPLGMGLAHVKTHDPLGTLPQIAKATGKTEAQVALNWIIVQEGVIAIPKASSPEHAAEDCESSGWRLSEADYHLLQEKISCKRASWAESTVRRWKRRARHLVDRYLLAKQSEMDGPRV